MRAYSLTHLTNGKLEQALKQLSAGHCVSDALLLAHIAEFDSRKLYRPAGYPSMYQYCVGALNYSHDSACKRIRAARAALRFPALFTAVAEGRLHVTAVRMLAPHLDEQNVDELMAAATHQTCEQIELLLARRFPRPDVPTSMWMVRVAAAPEPQLALRRVGTNDTDPTQAATALLVPGHDAVDPPARGDDLASPSAERTMLAEVSESSSRGAELASRRVAGIPPTQLAPLSPDSFFLQVTLPLRGHDVLREAQELLSHDIPSGDVPQVILHMFETAVAEYRKRKFAATDKPRPSRGSSQNPRRIPAAVKRAVRQRDQGRCTFVGESGRRCGSRRFLEYDHVDPVARGGQATIEGIRLRCRAHNQYEAEQVFGAGFMEEKREAARCAAAERAQVRRSIAEHTEAEREAARRATALVAEAQARAEAKERDRVATKERAWAAAKERVRSVSAGLRGIGLRDDQSVLQAPS